MKIVVHCSATPDGRDVDAATIHEWHSNRGWSGIGYHYVIKRDGTIENGRPEYWTGAHAKGHNKGSLGICMIGQEKFTQVQFASLWALILNIKERKGKIEVVSHYKLDSSKTCPNFDAELAYANYLLNQFSPEGGYYTT